LHELAQLVVCDTAREYDNRDKGLFVGHEFDHLTRRQVGQAVSAQNQIPLTIVEILFNRHAGLEALGFEHETSLTQESTGLLGVVWGLIEY